MKHSLPQFQTGAVWAAVLLATILLSSLFGAALKTSSLYAIYQIGFVILPGACLVLLAARRKLRPASFAAKAIIVGQCFEMLTGLVCMICSAKALYPFLLIGYIVGAWVLRRKFAAVLLPSSERYTTKAIAFVIAVFLVFAASLFNFDPVVDQHFTWVAAFAQSVTGAWPPTEPFLMDVPLHYHYLYNVHVGMAAYTTGVPVVVIASRTAIIFHSLAFILCLFAFASARIGLGMLGVVAATAMLLTFGYSEVMWKEFHFATASIMYRVASTIVAFQIFVLLVDEALTPKKERVSVWLLCLAMFAASGTRANLLPMFAAGLGMLGLVHCRDRSRVLDSAALFAIAAACIVAGSVLFLGAGIGPSDGTKLLLLHPLNLAVADWGGGELSPFVTTLQRAGAPDWLTSICYLIVALCGRLTFLLPGAVYVVCGSNRVDRDTKILLGGVALGGLTLLLLVETVVSQEVWAFYWYADIALALLGAAGLWCMWCDQPRSKIAALGVVLSCALFVMQAAEFSIGFLPKLAHSTFPTPAPAFQTASLEKVSRSLVGVAKAGDVFVTGGDFKEVDDRPFAAVVPGLQLYGSRSILPVYASRTNVNPHVASRLWLLNNDLASYSDRAKVRADVGNRRSLYMLWIGPTPLDRVGMSLVASWPAESLWKIGH